MTLQVVDAAVRNAKASPTIEEVGGKLILTIEIITLMSKSNFLESISPDNCQFLQKSTSSDYCQYLFQVREEEEEDVTEESSPYTEGETLKL